MLVLDPTMSSGTFSWRFPAKPAYNLHKWILMEYQQSSDIRARRLYI